MILRAAAGLKVHCLVLGDFLTNCYVLLAPCARRGSDDTGGEACWVVDPGLEPAPLLDHLRRSGAAPERIVLTHGHADHIAGVGAVKQAYPAAVITAPAADAGMHADALANLSLLFGLEVTAPPADQTVSPGDALGLGALTWQVLDASGHTPGGVAYYSPEAKVVLTGDSLFAGSIGRTDLPGASEVRLLANIRAHLLTLPDETRVLPGHGEPSTIAQERRSNPFL